MQGIMYLLFLLFSVEVYGQSGDKTVNILVDMGFENVGWNEDEKERVYLIQNTAYRLNGIGIGKAVDVIQKSGMPDNKACRIIVLENNIPQISLYYEPITDSIASPQRADWDVSYDLGDTWQQARKSKQNSSLFKVDMVVYPELGLQNVVITQIYQVVFNLSPAIEVSLWKGMKLTAQVVLPVYCDGFPDEYRKVRPNFVNVSQSFRLPYNIWGTLTVGHFNSNRYGADLQLKHRFVRDNRFGWDARLGYTGAAVWDGFVCRYSTHRIWTWSLGGYFYWPKYNIEATAKYERYLLGETGVRVDLIRHFRYASIGFFAMKSWHVIPSKNREVSANGGFRFQVALPPYKYKRKGYIPRVTPSRNMGMAYNAGSEQYYYKSYRPTAGDNIMQSNSLNPYFIKSELLNF